MQSTKGEGAVELKRSLGFAGVLGQSIAGEAPTATPAVNVALVFVAVGSGSWLVFLVATLAILLVSLNIVPLARTGSAAGSLSDFVGRGLGETWRLITGWILLLAYLSTGVAVLAACVGYLGTLLAALGVQVPAVVLTGIIGAVASGLALRNVRISTGVMLGLELFSITLVLLLCLVILYRQGLAVDLSQMRLEGFSLEGMNGALLIGILSFAGFETAAVLGDEAKDPLRTIPRALIATPALTGLFFIFSSYVLVLGFHQYGVDVGATSTPLDVLADRIQRPELGILISFGATISLFGCTVATLLATSRIAFSLARQGALPSGLSVVTPRSFIPRNAMLAAIAIVLASAVGFACFAKPMDAYDWFGSFATFGFVSAYLLTCVSAPIFLRARGELRIWSMAISIAAIGVLLYVLFSSIYPVPASPLNLLPWLFIGLLVTGTAGSIWLRRRRS
jgi:amino acid transporter